MTKILLVEDDKSLREIYGVRLLAEGYDIVSAGDGEEALAMAIKDRPQLIVSDVMMPKISGFDMLDILRSTTETRDIKVIMMTALSSEDQRARGEQLGADRYLVKSQVGIEDVVRTVHEVLGDAPVTQQTPQQVFNRPAPQPATRPAEPSVPERPTEQTISQPQQPSVPQPEPVSVPQEPRPQPVSTPPQAPPAPTPVTPNPNPDFSLPQPTAPFSSPRPANLGERIIHPIETPTNTMPDVASLMNQELDSVTQSDTSSPVAPPPPPSIPQQAPYTPPPIPQEDHPSISFEETNRPAPSAPQNTPPSSTPQQ